MLTDSSIAGRGFWLLVGLACLAVYRATRVAYTVLQARNGNVFIIQDRRTHDSILGELMKRRKEQLLLLYGTVDGDSTLENEVAKFKYLQEQQVLSSAEAAARIAQAEGIFGAPVPAARRVLN